MPDSESSPRDVYKAMHDENYKKKTEINKRHSKALHSTIKDMGYDFEKDKHSKSEVRQLMMDSLKKYYKEQGLIEEESAVSEAFLEGKLNEIQRYGLGVAELQRQLNNGEGISAINGAIELYKEMAHDDVFNGVYHRHVEKKIEEDPSHLDKLVDGYFDYHDAHDEDKLNVKLHFKQNVEMKLRGKKQNRTVG